MFNFDTENHHLEEQAMPMYDYYYCPPGGEWRQVTIDEYIHGRLFDVEGQYAQHDHMGIGKIWVPNK